MWRSDGGAGKEAGEIDNVHAIRQVGDLNLKDCAALLPPVEFGSAGHIHRKVGAHAAARQIHLA